MKKLFLIKLIAMSALLFLAMMASHFLIYKVYIVPQLPNLKSVPLSWWLGAFAPELIIFLIFGYSLKSWQELLVFSLIAGFIQQIFVYLMSNWNEPGYLKSYESAIFHWTVGLVVVGIISAILFSIGMLLAKATKRRMKFA
jgi:hypothetical protein